MFSSFVAGNSLVKCSSGGIRFPTTAWHFTRGAFLSKVGSYSKATAHKETMARRKQTEDENTHQPLAKLLGILSSPWTMLLLHLLHTEGPMRFGELKRRLGAISTKTLTERLRLLEAEEWISRHYE